MSYNNILVDPITHRITGIVRPGQGMRLSEPLWAIPRIPELLEGPEVLQIPDPAPPSVEGAKELEKGLDFRVDPSATHFLQ